MENAEPRTVPLAKRGFNFEIIMWFYTRLSALAMYALIIAGFIGAFVVSAPRATRRTFSAGPSWTVGNPLSAMP
jgi:hypothetical protein